MSWSIVTLICLASKSNASLFGLKMVSSKEGLAKALFIAFYHTESEKDVYDNNKEEEGEEGRRREEKRREVEESQHLPFLLYRPRPSFLLFPLRKRLLLLLPSFFFFIPECLHSLDKCSSSQLARTRLKTVAHSESAAVQFYNHCLALTRWTFEQGGGEIS